MRVPHYVTQAGRMLDVDPRTVVRALEIFIYHGGEAGPRPFDAMAHALDAASNGEEATEQAERAAIDHEVARWRARTRVVVSGKQR